MLHSPARQGTMSDNMTPRRIQHCAGIAALGLSTALCMAISLCYYLRPDSCAAVTVFPPWVWLTPGLLLVGLGWSRARKRSVAVVAVLWLTYLLVFADESRGLIRAVYWHPPSRDSSLRDRTLRVVSINCAGGRKEAAEEVADYHPDIVLVQESPSPQHVEELARQFFRDDAGVFRWGDVSVIARGSVAAASSPADFPSYCVHTRVRLTSGIEAEVVNIHLSVPPVRTDLWNPDCWRAYATNRRRQRRQMRNIAERIESIPDTTPLIVGGDFNAPAGDAVSHLLRPRLHDTFKEGGVGWGNTFLSDIPLLRIDQIWTSDHFRAVRVRARKTEHSDHRMVVCDLLARAKRSNSSGNNG